MLRQTDGGKRVGAQSEFELLRARVARDNQRPVVIQRRNDRVLAYSRLKQLLNVPLGDEVRLTTGVEDLDPRFATVSDLAPARALGSAPGGGERDGEPGAAHRGARPADARDLALVALCAGGLSAQRPPSWNDFREDWTVSVSLNVPILTWGRLRGGEMVAQGNLSEAQARLQQSIEAAAAGRPELAERPCDGPGDVQSNTSTVEEARRAYSIAQIRYREGISSQIELTDSRLQLEQAEVSRARALRDVQVARARLALLRDLPLGQTAGAGTTIQTTQQNTQPSAAATGASQSTVLGTPAAVGARHQRHREPTMSLKTFPILLLLLALPGCHRGDKAKEEAEQTPPPVAVGAADAAIVVAARWPPGRCSREA